MNDFTKAESELVDNIYDMVISEAVIGCTGYAQKADWYAAATAVIELVKEKLSAIH